MKKVALLAALFLGGMAAQATTNQQENLGEIVQINSHIGIQFIEFAENGVLFKVAPNGSFTFEFLYPYTTFRNRRNNNVVYYENGRRGNSAHYNQNFRQTRRDRYGNIVQVSNVLITYDKKGKLRSIGDVKFKYHKGRLIKAGGMEITYNRFGTVRDTYGFVHDKKDWHDDWYINNNDDYFEGVYAVEDNRRDRVRKKK